EFIEKFRANPGSNAINYEPVHQARDPNLRSVRIDQAYRGIVLKPEAGNVYVLLWVDHHDAAYQWAQRRVFGINPETGSLQVIDVTNQTPAQPSQSRPTPKLFDRFKDREMKRIGVPEALLPFVRTIESEAHL